MTNTLIIFLAAYLYLFVAALALVSVLLIGRPDRLKLLALALVALPLAYLLAKLSGMLIISPRPPLTDHIQPLIQTATDNGFPSDHTLLAMTAAMLVFACNRRIGTILIMLAAGVGAGRVLAHAHHPIDVIGSTVIAAVAVLVAWLVEPKLRLLIARMAIPNP